MLCGPSSSLNPQVPATGPEGVGDPRPQTMEMAHHGLEPSTRSSHQSDPAPAHAVGEAKPDASDHRSPAIRPHDQQPTLPSFDFEGHFVLERDVVAIEEDVTAMIEGFVGHLQQDARLREVASKGA